MVGTMKSAKVLSYNYALFFAALGLTLSVNFQLSSACNSKTGNTSPIPSLNKADLPGLTWPGTDVETERLIQAQMKALQEYNKEMKIIKGTLSAAGSAIPLKVLTVPLKSVNDLLLVLESTTTLERKLTEHRISTDILKLTINELKAETNAIKRRLAKANDVNLDRRFREDEILHAIGAAEKLLDLFKNPKYPFAETKVVSFPYLATFATVFGFVGRYASELRQDYAATFEEYFVEMRQLIKDYATQAWIDRVRLVIQDGNKDCRYLVHTTQKFQESCYIYKRLDSNVDEDRSSCYAPNAADSKKVGSNSCGIWASSIHDAGIDKTFCAGEGECYNSYMTKLKSQFHQLVDTALESVQSLNLVPGSPSPLEQGCSVNYFPVPKIRLGADRGEHFQYEAFDAFNADPSVKNSDNYVCRVNISGNILPGKSNGGKCWFANGSLEGTAQSSYEILAHTWSWRQTKRLKWKHVEENGTIPEEAVLAGIYNQEPVYVGRCFLRNFYVTGSVKEGVTYATYGGSVYNCKGLSTQILVCE